MSIIHINSTFSGAPFNLMQRMSHFTPAPYFCKLLIMNRYDIKKPATTKDKSIINALIINSAFTQKCDTGMSRFLRQENVANRKLTIIDIQHVVF